MLVMRGLEPGISAALGDCRVGPGHDGDGGSAPREPDLGRRGLLMSGLAAGLALAAAPAEAQVVHTDTAGLFVGEAQITVSDGPIPAYYARPAQGGPFGTVLVIEEIFGVNDWLKDVCRRLAKAGLLAVAPELYARIGDLVRMKDMHQIQRDVISHAPDARMLRDLDATASWAAANGGDPKRLGVMGFGQGGRDAWLYAEHNPHLKAAVVWYGPVSGPTSPIQPHTPLALAGQLKCPLLGLYGGKDASTKPKEVNAAADKAEAAGRTVVIAWFPDAPAGFAADDRPTYTAEDAANGWKRALAWFKEHGLA